MYGSTVNGVTRYTRQNLDSIAKDYVKDLRVKASGSQVKYRLTNWELVLRKDKPAALAVHMRVSKNGGKDREEIISILL